MTISRCLLPKASGALLLMSILSGCGGNNPSVPTVLSSSPVNGATGAPLNVAINATFSEAMDPTSINTTTFTLTSGSPAVPVQGTVIYASSKAVFWPTALLASNTSFTATIGTGAKSASEVPVTDRYAWTFTTGSTVLAGVPVSLGTSGQFAALAKSAISTVPTSAVTGDVAVSPAAASYVTGFSLIMDPTNVFSTSTQVTGKVYAADYAVPTPANLTTAVSDMELAFTDAAGRAPDITELGAGDVGGMTLAAGVYKWSSGLLIPTDLTLSGTATDVWVFQIAQNLTVANATTVHLSGGALANNVFWQVSGSVELGTTAHVEGIVLSLTAINLGTGASINGRLLAQTAVSIDASTVVAPAP
jgi:hypothetical protein